VNNVVGIPIVGVCVWDVRGKTPGLLKWKTADGRSGSLPPSDLEIYDMVLAFERYKLKNGSDAAETKKQMTAEMAVSGVVLNNFDCSGRPIVSGAPRWFCIDGRSGSPRMSERDIKTQVLEWAREMNYPRRDELRMALLARGVRVDGDRGWFTAGPRGLSGPIPSLDRSCPPPRRDHYAEDERRGGRAGGREALPGPRPCRPPSKRPRSPSPGREQRPTRRHLVAAPPSSSGASSDD
jgi:hypothetical protein